MKAIFFGSDSILQVKINLRTHHNKIFVEKSTNSELKLEYIRKQAVRLLRLREQHTPPRSVVVIVVSLQLMHFLIHAHGGKLAII